MIAFLARRKIDAFEKKFSYDLGYAREILEVSPRALWLFTRATQLGQFRRGVPFEVYVAAQLTAVLHEDCGPCVQLGLDLAEQAGVAPELLKAVVAGDLQSLPEGCALAVRFATAIARRDPAADSLREELIARYGLLGLVSLAFALTSARIYPTVKYALGYGKTCSRVVIGGQALTPHKPLETSEVHIRPA